MARETRQVTFITKYGVYNAGDHASFGVSAAEKLIQARYAKPFGGRAVVTKAEAPAKPEAPAESEALAEPEAPTMRRGRRSR